MGIDHLNAGGSTNSPATAGCDGNVGPFIPAYFKLQLLDARTFHYSGEPFPLLVSAMNTAGAVTVNYSSTLGLSETVTLAANDKTGTAFSPVPGTLSNAAVAATAFKEGVASLNGTATNGIVLPKPSYTFTTVPTAPTQIRLRATNNKAGTAAVLSSAPAAAEEAAMPVIRSGRLRLGNRFGGLKSTLSIPVTAEYWTGRSWLLNSDDVYTVIPQNSFAIKPLVSGMTVAHSFASNPVKLANGAAAFDLRVTGGGPGPVDIAINIGSSLQDNSCIGNTVGTGLATFGAAIPWLRPVTIGCNPSPLARDPYSRVNFGVYTPENRRIIHVREVFN
jgi:MSHA biogenesis protein MshQ